jgi:hypothetical protein
MSPTERATTLEGMSREQRAATLAARDQESMRAALSDTQAAVLEMVHDKDKVISAHCLTSPWLTYQRITHSLPHPPMAQTLAASR